MIRRAAAPLLLFLTALALTGCGRNVERIAERKVNAILPDVLGPADKYATRVRGSVTGLAKGRLSGVHVEGDRVRLDDSVTLTKLTLDLDQVDVDTNAGRLRSVERVRFAGTMGEADLNRVVRAKRPDIPELRIALGGGGTATVYARPELAELVGVPVQVRGSLVPRPGGRLLDFSPDAARVSIVPIPGVVRDFVARRVNPVLDLSALRVPIQIERVTIERGVVRFEGFVAPEDLLAAQPAASGRR